MFVIRERGTGHYVAKPGSKKIYTNRIENAQKFTTREEAERHRCGNESVVSVDSVMRRR